MARITVEDCLTKETNRFALVHLASQRAKQILAGAKSTMTERGNRSVVTALREIAAGLVKFKTEEDLRLEREQQQLQAENQVQIKDERTAKAREAFDELFIKPGRLAGGEGDDEDGGDLEGEEEDDLLDGDDDLDDDLDDSDDDLDGDDDADDDADVESADKEEDKE